MVEDASVIRCRQGRDARSTHSIKFACADTMELAARVADESARRRVDAPESRWTRNIAKPPKMRLDVSPPHN